MNANLEKFVWTGVAAAVALMIGTAPIAAGSGPKPTIAKPQTHATMSPKQTVHGGGSTHATATTTHGKSATHTTMKASSPKKSGTTTAAATTTKKNGKTTKTAAATTTTGGTTAGTTTGGTTGTVTPTSDVTTLSKAQRLLAKNTNLASKLSTQLGNLTSTQLCAYAAGFKNLGQFVAATNVSTNQNIDFAQLKAAMTGYGIDGKPIVNTSGTPTTTLSLGQAIQQLKGTDTTTATEAAKTATTQANTVITTTTTTTTATKGKTKKQRGH